MGQQHDSLEQGILELCEIGELGIRSDGHWHAVRGALTLTALAALSIHRSGGVRTEALIEAIWPSPGQPPTARQSLANLVARLRSAHGDGLIESTGNGYRLGANVVSDRAQLLIEVERAAQLVAHDPALALEATDAALARVRGRPWANVESPEQVPADRATLEENTARAHRLRASALVALDRAAEAIPLLERLVDDDSVDESKWLDLAHAEAALGRRVEALRTLRRARNELANYGLTIGESAAELERRLVQGTPEFACSGADFPDTPTSLLGRDGLLEDSDALLRSNRVLTFCGPGGVGKTRLAIELATRLHADASYFVDLSPVRDDRSVPSAIAASLGVVVPTGTAPTDALINEFESRNVLLVLDNCEQIVDAAGLLVSAIVSDCDALRVIVTSRAHLGIRAEHVVNVEPLPTDSAGAGVQLFFDRAHRLGVDLPTDVWLEPVTRLCTALDGLPLSIELAAGRSTVLNPSEILDALAERFVILRDVDGTRGLDETIRWSWDLLDHSEQRALHQLSVFQSGATLSAAARVLELDRWAVLDLAEQLSRQSLLHIRHAADRPTRLELLDTIRFFVLEDAEQRDVITKYRDAHLIWIDELTTEAQGEHGNAGGPDANPLIKLDDERHEIRAALDYAASSTGDAARGVRICNRCFHWWRGRSSTAEGANRLKVLLRQADLEIVDRVGASATLASLARIAAVPDAEVESLVKESYRLLATVPPGGDRDRLELRLAEADFDGADSTLGPRLRQLANSEASGDDATALHLLTAWTIANDPAGAPAVAMELAVEAETASSDACKGHSRELQGLAAIATGSLGEACGHLSAAVDILEGTGQTFCVIHCCESIAWLAIESGEVETGRQLIACTEGVRRKHGRTRAGFEEQSIAGVVRNLGQLPQPNTAAETETTIDSARRIASRLGERLGQRPATEAR